MFGHQQLDVCGSDYTLDGGNFITINFVKIAHSIFDLAVFSDALVMNSL